ncbi:MAG: hypothetical protein COV66_14700 [Nitrospinae bacterium CG11_big_fil_rev_8_21_14_0_20_45_15]|nr:MAG: hypothetical protein COV66_14700 [Nitrospinae bacterium CG11_big_fil_rev_8_21_14_0_20_45_15]
MKRKIASTSAIAMALILTVATAQAKKSDYVETEVKEGGSLSGSVLFTGNVPAPIMEDLKKGKNTDFCANHPDTNADKIRPRYHVRVQDGKLLDAVVYVEEIETGKAWSTTPTTFDFKNCDIFPKVSVVHKPDKGTNDGLVKIENQDPNILHNPHGYSVDGANRKTLFNKPLPSKGDVADVTKTLKRLKKAKDSHFFLQCDQHNFMEADAKIVWNPYYAVTDDKGSFKIDNIPAGNYKVTVWHPYVGETTQEVTVTAGKDSVQDFNLASK